MGLMFAPAPAEAQPEFVKENFTKIIRKVGFHANISVSEPLDGDVTKGTTFGGSVVLGGGRSPGWRYPVALTTFKENLHAPGGAQFAVLRSWSIVGGIGYGWNFGKLSTGWQVQTGVAINSGRLDGNASQAFGSDGPVSLEIGNSLLLRPRLKAEYYITPKLTLLTSAGYLLTKPRITVTTPTGTVTNRWNASNFHATFGIGFYPFRK